MLKDMKIYVKMYDFILWLLPHTQRFPKSQRFTLAQRIDSAALELLEYIIQANEERDKRETLKRASVELEKLRILIRLSKDLAFLPHKSYEYSVRELDEIGRLLGGWIKQQGRIN